MKSFISSLLGNDTKEYTKKWMARFTTVVLALLLFIMVLVLMLLVLHLKFGLSRQMCDIFMKYYTTFAKFLITSYSVTYIGYMGKAFMAKREEEKNKKSNAEKSVESEEEL